MGLDIGIIWMVDHESNELYCAETWIRSGLEKYEEMNRFINEVSKRRISSGEGVAGRALQFKEADWIGDISSDFDVEVPKIGEELNIYSAFSFPFLDEETVLGVFEFFFPFTTLLSSSLMSTLSDISTQISVAITRDRFATELKKSTLRLTAQYGAMRALSETFTLEDLAKKLLQAICEPLGWQFGLLWMVDNLSNDMHCIGIWNPGDVEAKEFEKLNLLMRISKGEDLPGRVWSFGQPLSSDQVSRDQDSQRLIAAKAADLNFAIGFPILLQNKVLGVLEFFIINSQDLNASLLSMLEVIGPQVGQFIERKKIEKELNESHKYKTAILEAASDSIITTNLDGEILSFNSKTLDLFYISREEIENKNIDDFIPNLSQKIIYLDKLSPTEFTGLRANGEKFPAEVTSSKTYLNNQQLLVCIIRDITERKNIEKMKSEFISVVSHELRTPLTSIKGAMSLLLGHFSEGLPEKSKNLLNIADKNCDRLILLINDILDIEKSESGKMIFKFKKMNIKDLLQEAVTGIEQYAKKFNVKIKTVNNEDIFVEADYDRLMQVLTNLLSNAIKFSFEHGTVVASIERIENVVRVSIKDEGKGIPEEFKPKIFQKFVQEESSTTRGVTGTGLGLSISKAIVESHQGKIDFISKKNEGSTFYFELPISLKEG